MKTLFPTDAVRIYGLPGDPNSLRIIIVFRHPSGLLLEIGVWEREASIVLDINIACYSLECSY